ncbi:MAG: DsbA family protein [Succinivibrionaceae bacterium]|nr:DsbA family protein [Succinivibrionaceae bacterium]
MRSKHLAAAALALLFTSAALAAPYAPGEERLSRADVEQIVHDYLLEHPEVLVEAAQRLDAINAEGRARALASFAKEVLSDPTYPSRGDQGAKHYMIEFSDYNCGYCKVMQPLIEEFVKKHGVRLVYVEFPILSEASVQAGTVGQALWDLDHDLYLRYHDTLMGDKARVKDLNDVKAALRRAGADWEKVKARLAKGGIEDLIARNVQKAQALQISGTPFFIIDGHELRGAVKTLVQLESLLSR